MKKNITYIAREKFETIVKKAGLAIRPQAAFGRVDGPNGRRLYIAATKQVGRVDASGWDVDVDGVTKLSKEEAKSLRLGAVRGQLDFSKPEAEILAAFKDLIADMIGDAEWTGDEVEAGEEVEADEELDQPTA